MSRERCFEFGAERGNRENHWCWIIIIIVILCACCRDGNDGRVGGIF